MNKKDSKEVKETLENATTEVNKEMNTESKKDAKKLTREQKKELRRNAIEKKGRLFLSDDCKEEGYIYRVCNVTPGNIETYIDKGYELVTHPITSGSGNINHPEVDGTPKEFEVGGATGSMKAVWMRISKEDDEILKEIERENAEAQANMIKSGIDPTTGQTMIPQANLIGTITKG